MGIRNNNWLNVKQVTPDPWKGSIGEDERGHVEFVAPEWGLRAAIKILWNYHRAGDRSIRQIVSRWAPATDTIGSIPGNAPNNPNDYARHAARWAGVDPDKSMTLFGASTGNAGPVVDSDRLTRLLQGMSIYESGTAAFSAIDRWRFQATALRAIQLYEKDFVL